MPMRTLPRSGIHIETCPACRGIFLDRGELDRLLDLEASVPRSGVRDATATHDQGGDEDGRRFNRRRGRKPDDDPGFERTKPRSRSRGRDFVGEISESFGDGSSAPSGRMKHPREASGAPP